MKMLWSFLLSASLLLCSALSNHCDAAVYAYVVNSGEDTVSVIDTATNTVIDTINVGHAPFGVVVDPTSGNYVYVTNQNENTVSVIDTWNNTVTATITVGVSPTGLDITPDENYVYVANQGEDNIDVIDTATNTVKNTINVGDAPFGVVVDPDGNYVYVTNKDDSTVSVIQTLDNTVTATITVGTSPSGLDVTPDGNRVYVANQNQNSVSVIETATNTIIKNIIVGFSPFGVVVNTDGNYVYVTNKNENTVSVIQTSNNTTITPNIPVGLSPSGLDVTPDGSAVYVANQGQDAMAVINTSTKNVTYTNVGHAPWSFGKFIGTVSTDTIDGNDSGTGFNDDDDGCFIATAAFGSAMESHVKILKNFRDCYLLTNRVGRGFVRFYYRYSPPVAHFIAKHESLKLLVRYALYPVVGLSYVALYTTPAQQTLIVLGLVFALGGALYCCGLRVASCRLKTKNTDSDPINGKKTRNTKRDH
jgi:YVTN family beta-propeller protein